MSGYPCGTRYSVTLVTAHAQCILVNHKVKGCFYMSQEKSSDNCGTTYSVLTECTAQHLYIVKDRTKPRALIGCWDLINSRW